MGGIAFAVRSFARIPLYWRAVLGTACLGITSGRLWAWESHAILSVNTHARIFQHSVAELSSVVYPDIFKFQAQMELGVSSEVAHSLPGADDPTKANDIKYSRDY